MTIQYVAPIELPIREFIPRPKLSVHETQIDKPKFPVIDAHNHLGETFGGGWSQKPVAELLEVMDSAGVRRLVDLDGGWGESILNARLEKYPACVDGREFRRWPKLRFRILASLREDRSS